MQLYQQAEVLLNTKGESYKTKIGIGAGHNVIGYRLENISCIATPKVNTEIEGKKYALQVVDNWKSGPNYSIHKAGILVNLVSGNNKDKQQLFKIGDKQVLNWRGEMANFEEMNMAKEILSFMKAPLADLPAEKRRRAFNFNDLVTEARRLQI